MTETTVCKCGHSMNTHYARSRHSNGPCFHRYKGASDCECKEYVPVEPSPAAPNAQPKTRPERFTHYDQWLNRLPDTYFASEADKLFSALESRIKHAEAIIAELVKKFEHIRELHRGEREINGFSECYDIADASIARATEKES